MAIMSFIGTQQKCKACGKTVYPVELFSVDGIDYHKSCFQCILLQRYPLGMTMVLLCDVCMICLSNYSSMEGVLYCMPHFEQLFKESGNLNKNFTSRTFFFHYFFILYKESGNFNNTTQVCLCVWKNVKGEADSNFTNTTQIYLCVCKNMPVSFF
ncbi:putative transcription factor interactor and regulator LIM family [Helianthus debilis subsp. tardiflorus]